MAKFLYTVASHAKIIVEKDGNLPKHVKAWLENHKFWDMAEIEFTTNLLTVIGYKCTLSFYYCYYLLDSTAGICFASTGRTDDEAKKLLFNIVPLNYMSSLKNPKYDKDARSVVARFKAN